MLDFKTLYWIFHLATSFIMIAFVLGGYKIIQKFKSSLISKFYKYLIVGAIPMIVYHLFESVSHYFNLMFIANATEIFSSLMIGEFTLFIFFIVTANGAVSVLKDYEKTRKMTIHQRIYQNEHLVHFIWTQKHNEICVKIMIQLKYLLILMIKLSEFKIQ